MLSCRTVLGSRSWVVVIYNKEGEQVEMACQVGSRKTHAQTTSRVQAVCVVLNLSPILNCGEADQIFSFVQALSNLSSITDQSPSVINKNNTSNQLPMWCLSSSVPVKVILSDIVKWMEVSAVCAHVVVGHVSSSKRCHCQVLSSRKCVIRQVLSKQSSSWVAWCRHMLESINCDDD